MATDVVSGATAPAHSNFTSLPRSLPTTPQELAYVYATEGVRHLYITGGSSTPWATRYTPNEMVELFTAEELQQLWKRGWFARGDMIHIDMVFGALNILNGIHSGDAGKNREGAGS